MQTQSYEKISNNSRQFWATLRLYFVSVSDNETFTKFAYVHLYHHYDHRRHQFIA